MTDKNAGSNEELLAEVVKLRTELSKLRDECTSLAVLQKEDEGAYKIWRRRCLQAEEARDAVLASIPQERANVLLETANLCDGEFPDFTKWIRSLAELEAKKEK